MAPFLINTKPLHTLYHTADYVLRMCGSNLFEMSFANPLLPTLFLLHSSSAPPAVVKIREQFAEEKGCAVYKMSSAVIIHDCFGLPDSSAVIIRVPGYRSRGPGSIPGAT
jgi:hypothetical protein